MNYLMCLATPTVFDSLDIMEATKQDYLSRLPKFLSWLQDNGINSDSLLQYKHYLRSRTDLGIASKNKYLTVARLAMKEAYRKGYISIDLSLNVKAFQQSQKHRVEGLSETEVERLCQHLWELPESFRTARLRALVALLLYQGLRQIEICRLDVADVDITSGRMYVLGKGRDDREPIYLHPQTIKALKTYIQRSRVKDGALFTSLWGQNKGRRLTTRGLRQIVKSLLATTECDKTVHGFRHYFTTVLIRSYQSDLLQVAHYTRHRSVETLQVYNDAMSDKEELARYYATFKIELS